MKLELLAALILIYAIFHVWSSPGKIMEAIRVIAFAMLGLIAGLSNGPVKSFIRGIADSVVTFVGWVGGLFS